jgi:uncharacterized membrane protein YkoI
VLEARAFILVVAATMSIATNGAIAADDQDRALSALDARQILPLNEILVRAQLGDDRLLRAELEREDGRYVYELRIIAKDGVIRLRRLDARTGEILPDGKLSDHPVQHKPDGDD